MTLDRLVVTSFAVALSLPALGAAQGLGDTAAREREKRAAQVAEKKKEPARVFTNDDLSAGRPAPEKGKGQKEAAPAGPGEPAASPPPESPEPEPPPDPQAAIRPQIEALRDAEERVAEAEQRVAAFAGMLNPMSGTYIYGPSGSNSANDEAAVRQQLQQAEESLREARAAVAAANEAVEEARRRWVPPSTTSSPY
jgi:hypothetical protein